MSNSFIQIDDVRIKKSNIKTYGKSTGNSIEVFKTEKEITLEQKVLDQEYESKLKIYENKYFKDNQEKNVFKRIIRGMTSPFIKIIKPRKEYAGQTKYTNQEYVYVTTYQGDNYRFCKYYTTNCHSSDYRHYLRCLEEYKNPGYTYDSEGVVTGTKRVEKPEEVAEKYIYREDFDYSSDKILEQLDNM